MWVDPKTYVDYHKLDDILQRIQNSLAKHSIEELHKIGGNWFPEKEDCATFSIFLNNKDKILNRIDNEMEGIIKDIQHLAGVNQCIINFIKPGDPIPDHTDGRDYYDNKEEVHEEKLKALEDVHFGQDTYQIILGIQIPSDDPTIVGFHVNNEIKGYRTGDIVAFDGNVIHGGWNNSNEYRITVCLDTDKKAFQNVA